MPFAWLYDGVTSLRNHLFNLGLKPSVSFDICVIGVGNLSVGGTGKTPMTEYLAKLLVPITTPAIISRGYGRHTKGFRFVGPDDTASTVGDEPFQFYRKLSPTCVIAVGEDRPLAVTRVVDEFPDMQVVLLDDTFQHRQIRPRLNILLTTYSKPFYKDAVLPAGRLRESARGASRCDIVVITKCPATLAGDEMDEMQKHVSTYTRSPVFFASTTYGTPVALGGPGGKPNGKVILVTGIADASPLKRYLSDQFGISGHFNFRDHHAYSEGELRMILGRFKETGSGSIFTTEKDAMRLIRPEFEAYRAAAPWFYVPVDHTFLKNGEEFDSKVRDAVAG